MRMANNQRGMMVVISGPSGSGKGTVMKILTQSPSYALSVSATTRAPRPGETDGKEYFFLSERDFLAKKDGGELLEHSEYNGFNYGTPKGYVDEKINLGKIVILEIDVPGAMQIKEKFKESILIFIMPPDKKELERRLVTRGTQTEVSLRERLRIADGEIAQINNYDYLVINDTVEDAVKRIETIVAAERLKPFRETEATEYFYKGEI